ncbi:peptidase [Clostridia bacterium]|nr:peptidase [Clostridia bacterium]
MTTIIYYLLAAVAAVIAVIAHEAARGLASAALGDGSPKRNRRLGVKLSHIDPLGLIMFVIFGYGWSNPVNTSAIYYKNRKAGTILVHTIPSVVNLLIGVIFACASNLVSLVPNYDAALILYSLSHTVARVNIAFAIFNIIPIYPLDGAKILSLFLSPNANVNVMRYEKILQIILVVALMFGVFATVITPLANVIINSLIFI